MQKVVEDLNPDIKVRFFCSATLEMVTSLHVISDSTHHANCMDWYELVSKTMSDDLRKRIENFGNKYANWLSAMDIIDYLIENEADASMYDDFELIMSKLEEMNDELFVYIFLGTTLLGNQKIAREFLANPNQVEPDDFVHVQSFISSENIISLLSNHKDVKAEMMSILKIYHTEIFESHWRTTKKQYWGIIYREKKTFEATSLLDYILSLHKDLVCEKGVIIMKNYESLSLEVAAIGEVRLFFSMFAYPHLMSTVFEDAISIYENIIPTQISDKYEHLANSMKGLSDVNRLAILRHISRAAVTNKELAFLLHITPASVSQHLKILKELDYITAIRRKNNIYYYINKDAVSRGIAGVAEFLNL